MSKFLRSANTVICISGMTIIFIFMIEPLGFIFDAYFTNPSKVNYTSFYASYVYGIVNILGFSNIITTYFQPLPKSTKRINWLVITLISAIMFSICAYYSMHCASFYPFESNVSTLETQVSQSKFILFGMIIYSILAILSLAVFAISPKRLLNSLYKQQQESNCVSDHAIYGNNNQFYN